jgi:hypothetical protein
MLKKFPSHKPSLVVRVGLVGPADLRTIGDFPLQSMYAALGKALRLIQREARGLNDSLLYDGTPRFRLLFAPAGGFEYLSAGEAIELGFDLQLLLPFDRGQYRKTFFSHTELAPLQEAFDLLLEVASEVVELDGSPSDRKAATEEVRQCLLRQCDVLIVISVGSGPNVTSLAQEASARGLPVLTINPYNDEISFYERGLRSTDPLKRGDIRDFKRGLEAAFVLTSDVKKLHRFLGPWHFRQLPLFRHFRDKVAHQWNLRIKRSKRVEPSDPWASLPCPNGAIGCKIADRFQQHFKRADRLADGYGDFYRSFFLLTYGFGALAVLLAFCGIYLKEHATFWVELGLISCVIFIVLIASTNRLHERWSDYRMLGEGLRQMAVLAPLARVTPTFEVPAYLDDDPGHTWFNWYFRALIREAGLISARMDKRFLKTYQDVLAEAIRGQVGYHTGNSEKMELVHKRLRRTVVFFLFPVTLLACIVHLIPESALEPHVGIYSFKRIDFFLSLFAIVFPAVGAALEGIAHQGDVDRIHRRSGALKSRLQTLHDRLVQIKGSITSRDLGNLAENFSQVQVLEQADWRAAFFSKPISLA